jgi:hypothetical protein
MESLVSYLVAAMIAWVPLHAHAPLESPEDTLARYESIARDLATVALDDDEEPLFAGDDGRVQTALLMASVASYESSYGKTVCLMQIRVGGGVTREGWSGSDLVRDRTLCFRAGLHILHSSFGACHRLPVEDRMSAYATGHCFENARVSRSRIGRARAWFAAHAPPRLEPSET